MNKNYVDLSTAIKLKKKGYEHPYIHSSVHIIKPITIKQPLQDIKITVQPGSFISNLELCKVYTDNLEECIIDAPSLWSVQQMLRERGVDVLPILKDDEYIKQYHITIYKYGSSKHTPRKGYKTYEEALSKGINIVLDTYF